MSVACYQTYSMDVILVAQAWWAMEDASTVTQTDSVRSLLLNRASGNVSDFSKVPGIIGQGEQIEPGSATASILSIVDNADLAFNGVGMTLTLWMNFTDVVPTPNNSFVLVNYVFDQNAVFYTLTLSRSSASAYSWRVLLNGVPLITKASAAGWHFFVLTFNAATGVVGFDIDQAGAAFQFAVVPPVGANTTGDIELNVTTLAGANELSVIFDEAALFPRILSAAQLNYLYNAGTGRTWPVTLP